MNQEREKEEKERECRREAVGRTTSADLAREACEIVQHEGRGLAWIRAKLIFHFRVITHRSDSDGGDKQKRSCLEAHRMRALLIDDLYFFFYVRYGSATAYQWCGVPVLLRSI